MIDWALVHADFLFSFNQWNSNVRWRLLNLPFGIVHGKKEKKRCFTSLLSANGYVKIRSDIRALEASLSVFVHPHGYINCLRGRIVTSQSTVNI